MYRYKKYEYVYDLEIWKNYFCMGIMNIHTGEIRRFTVYQDQEDKSRNIDDRKEMFEFLYKCMRNKKDVVMYSFNGYKFDYPIIHMLLRSKKFTYIDIDKFLLYTNDKCLDLINSERSGVPERFHYIEQIDLMKVWGYDNKNKRVSLKSLEISMDMHNVEDLPFDFDSYINYEDLPIINSYNNLDLEATKQFYLVTIGVTDNPIYEGGNKLQLRENMGKMFGLDNIMGASDVKMTKEYFTKLLAEIRGISVDEAKRLRTIRDRVDIKDIIYDYIHFETDILQAAKELLAERRIYIDLDKSEEEKKEAKSISTIYVSKPNGDYIKVAIFTLEERRRYHKLVKELESKYKLNWRETRGESKAKKGLSVVYKGMIYDLGLGGLHSCIKGGSYVKKEGRTILDVDVTSYYPINSIKNKVYPEHFSIDFCPKYEKLFYERKKWPKKTVENLGIKLMLNGAYGLTKDFFSPLYDPKHTYTITITGELMLMMLVEQLVNRTNCTVLQTNTDGVTIDIDNKELPVVYEIIKWWEDLTQLNLEDATYEAMYIRDVNNYIAVFENKKEIPKEEYMKELTNPSFRVKISEDNGIYYAQGVKLKGDYEIYKEFHKDSSNRISTIALFNKLVYGKKIMDTLTHHKDNILLFCKRYKATKGFEVIYRTIDVDKQVEKKLSKNVRYYVSTTPETIVKIKEGREISIEKKKNCTPFNMYIEKEDYNIDFSYYVRETNKLLEDLIPKQQTLF